MTILEKNSQGLYVVSLPPALDPGDGHLLLIVCGGLGRAEDPDVPAQVEGGGGGDPLSVLPLPAGQVSQATGLSLEDNFNCGPLDILGHLAEVVTDL